MCGVNRTQNALSVSMCQTTCDTISNAYCVDGVVCLHYKCDYIYLKKKKKRMGILGLNIEMYIFSNLSLYIYDFDIFCDDVCLS